MGDPVAAEASPSAWVVALSGLTTRPAGWTQTPAVAAPLALAPKTVRKHILDRPARLGQGARRHPGAYRQVGLADQATSHVDSATAQD